MADGCTWEYWGSYMATRITTAALVGVTCWLLIRFVLLLHRLTLLHSPASPLLREGIFITDPHVMRLRKNSPGPKKLATLCTRVDGTVTSFSQNYMCKFFLSLMLWSSGLWHRVVLCTDTNVSEENDLSLFRVKMFLRNPQDYTLTKARGPHS
jgi:hypothetical protein